MQGVNQFRPVSFHDTKKVRDMDVVY